MTLGTWLQDVRFGARIMRRSPAFSLTAAIVLSLGIGVNTALFSIVNALFFRDLHVKAPEELFLMYDEALSRQLFPHSTTRLGDRDPLINETLAEFSGRWTQFRRVTVGDETEPAAGEVVETNYFDFLGVRMSMGRGFRAEDKEPSNPELPIVVSDAFWRKRLAADPAVIGRAVRIDDMHFRVVGVTEPGFAGLSDPLHAAHFWIPQRQYRPGSVPVIGVIGRLKPGATFDQYKAFVEAQTPRYKAIVTERYDAAMRERYRDWMKFAQFPVYRLTDLTYPDNPKLTIIPPKILSAMVTVVVLVLVIASANIAGLLLARGVTRTSEVAVRRALGAGGSRLLRQLLTESVLLAGLGGVLGFFVAWTLVALFRALTPSSFVVDVTLDLRVLLFAAALCVGAGVLVGLAPALQALRVNVLEALGAGIIGARRVRTRLRHGIVVPQVALSLVLLVVAAVHVRALTDIELNDLGYRTDDTIVLGVSRWEPRPQFAQRTREESMRLQNEEAAKVRAFNRNILANLANVPNLHDFALVSSLPVHSFGTTGTEVVSKETHAPGATSAAQASRIMVTDDYFDVMGMRLLHGRTFDGRDVYGGKAAAVISQSIARTMWPTADPIGKVLAFQPQAGQQMEWLEVIGVVNEVDPVLGDIGERPMVYVSVLQQWRGGAGQIVLRGNGQSAAIIKAAKAAVLAADGFAEVSQVRTMRQVVSEILYPRRLAAAILASSGLIGLALACIGLYGVMSYSIAQRRREIGIRATLGADRRDIVRLVLREGAAVTLLGTAIGGALTFIALRLSANVIAGVPMLDVVSFVTVPLVLMLIVVAACLVPAFKAANTDPAIVLRA